MIFFARALKLSIVAVVYRSVCMALGALKTFNDHINSTLIYS